MNRPEGPSGHLVHHGHRVGFLLLILAVVALAALVAYLVSRRGRRFGPMAGGPRPLAGYAGADRALDLARMRYAQGELSREAYLQMVGDLGGQPYPSAPPTPPTPPSPPASASPTEPMPGA